MNNCYSTVGMMHKTAGTEQQPLPSHSWRREAGAVWGCACADGRGVVENHMRETSLPQLILQPCFIKNK